MSSQSLEMSFQGGKYKFVRDDVLQQRQFLEGNWQAEVYLPEARNSLISEGESGKHITASQCR